MPYCSFACSAFALLVDGNIGVSVFPEGEEALVCRQRPGGAGRQTLLHAGTLTGFTVPHMPRHAPSRGQLCGMRHERHRLPHRTEFPTFGYAATAIPGNTTRGTL